MTKTSNINNNTLYLIYDGDCILCRNTAQAIKIKKSVGHLEIINARTSHPLVTEALQNGYDLNEGILVKYNDHYYYGSDAVNFLALIGSPSDWFNKINSSLFKYKWLSNFCYPLFKFFRNTILYFRGIPQLSQPVQKPLIKEIYGDKAETIPKLLQDRYLNRPYSKDKLLLKGEMNIEIPKAFQRLSPLFRLAGALTPYPGNNIPATVEMISDEKSDQIRMLRTFYYPDKKPYQFYSLVIHVKDNIVIERMKFGFASKLIYTYRDNEIIMNYGGYVLCIGKLLIPIPLGLLIGKFHAFEKAVSNEKFEMEVKMTHPLFGKIFQYDGYFKIVTPHE